MLFYHCTKFQSELILRNICRHKYHLNKLSLSISRFYTLGVQGIASTTNIFSLPTNDINNSDISPEKEKQNYLLNDDDINKSNHDLSLSNDISELFNIFETEPTIGSKTNLSKYTTAKRTDKQLTTSQHSSTNVSLEEEYSKKTNKQGKLNSHNGCHQIVMKSSESFPINDALKEVILDLNIGSTVRNFLK